MSSIIENDEIIITNPITLKEINRIQCSKPSEILEIINRSNNYETWRSLTLKKRCLLINTFRKAIVKNQSKIKEVLKSETGKKDFDTFIELFSLVEHLKEISKIAKKSLKPSYRSAGIMKNKKAYVLYEPLGIAGIISPWNYPLATPITSTVQALLAGNNVVLKPSEHTPLTAIYLKELWDTYVGYNEAFNIVMGGGDAGKTIVDCENIDIICFTGSTAVGKSIAEKCSKTLKPVILELGGKDPMIVLKDANIKRSIESALFAGYSNAGQTCISVEEIFVEKEIFNTYVELISGKVKALSSGNDASMQIGPMIMTENCNKVKEHIEEIRNQEKIIKGSSIEHSMYIAPTLIIEPPLDARVVNEETFGPVISLRSFDSEAGLLEMVHKTGYGLAGSIFGSNIKRVKRILSTLKIGNVSINDVFSHYGIASLPFGGEGLSGFGRLHGKEGLRSLCRIKSVVENRFNFLPDPWWFSTSKRFEGLLHRFLKFYYKI